MKHRDNTVGIFFVIFISLFFLVFSLFMFFEFVFRGNIPFPNISIPMLIGFVIGESMFTFFRFIGKYREEKLYNIALRILIDKINGEKNESV